MSGTLYERWQQSKKTSPDRSELIQARWIWEYKHERLGKEAAEKEAKQRNIPEARINSVLWFPIAGFDHEGDPCGCKAQVWLNGACLGCGAKKEGG